MKRYEKYKDSEVEWIGEIPTHWIAKSFRYCIDILTDYTANGSFASLAENVTYQNHGYSRLVRLTDLRDNLLNEGIYVSEEAHRYLRKSELFGGELLIANVGAYAGLVTVMPKLDSKMTLGPNMFLVKTEASCNEMFFYYLLSSPCCSEQLKMMAVSSAQPKLNKENIRQLKVVVPPIDEQLRISEFLDQKTEKIDTLISKKEKLIELLQNERTAMVEHAVTKGLDPNVPMKDSGIEWLGNIPNHWEVKRLKYIVGSPLKYGANESAEDENLHHPRYIRITDFGFDGKLRTDTFKSLPPEIANDYLLKEGDLLFARSGATVGKTFQFKNFNGSACFAGYLIRASFNAGQMNSDFINYYTKTNYYENWKQSVFQQATIQNIGADKYNQWQVAFPPSIDEQQDIAKHLDFVLQKLANVESKISAEIGLLKEYKVALISEAVTGKIDIQQESLSES